MSRIKTNQQGFGGIDLVLVLVILVLLVVFGGLVYKREHKKTTSNTSTTSTTPTTPIPAASVNNSVLITKTDATLGNYLANPAGSALYTYSLDTNGVSKCAGSCLTSWPIYQDKGAITGLPTNVSTIKRSDSGQYQYAYRGAPLYLFAGDSVGKVTGNGISDFKVAKP